MSIETDLRTLLLSFDAVADIVADRIRPDILDEGDEMPAIIFEIDSEEDGDLDSLIKTTLIVRCIATEKEDARALSEAVKNNGTPGEGLAGYRGVAGDGYINGATLDDSRPERAALEDGSDAGWYEVEQQYTVWYEEDV